MCPLRVSDTDQQLQLGPARTVSTQPESVYGLGGPATPIPGALIVFSHNVPLLRAIPVNPGPVMLGREVSKDQPLPDPNISAQHLEVSFADGSWKLRSVGRNGTYVNGSKLDGPGTAPMDAMVRMGRTIALLCADLTPFLASGVDIQDGLVIGPRLRRELDAIRNAAQPGLASARTLFVTGQTGTGKELAATTFHRAAAPNGPMIRVNCSTFPPGRADGYLFGWVKGAFTGATSDRRGFLEEADKGVLFLDEIADLPLEVQPALLRAVETGEFYRLGDMERLIKVDVRYVSATCRDIDALRSRGEFRADLYHRLAKARVHLPPLAERREEIPWLVANALALAPVRVPHASLIEHALLREWEGNARDLVSAVHTAARNAQLQSSETVRAEHLPGWQGPVASAERPTGGMTPPFLGAAPAAQRKHAPDLPKEQVIAAMEQAGGNAAAAARALGLHRNQLNRLRKKYGLQPSKPGQDGEDGEEDGGEGGEGEA